MKKIFSLLAITSFGIFALASCGKTAENTNTAANQNTTATNNTAVKTNTAATKTDEPASVIMKPGDASPDKTVKVVDLVDSVAADKDAWKGKEVTVTGFVSGTSGSGDHLLLTLTSEQMATNKRQVSCAVKGVKSDEVFSKTVEVKGKIFNANMDGEYKSVNLEPCEIKK